MVVKGNSRKIHLVKVKEQSLKWNVPLDELMEFEKRKKMKINFNNFYYKEEREG